MNPIKFLKYYMHNMVIKCTFLLNITNKNTNIPCKFVIVIAKEIEFSNISSENNEI